MGIVSFNLKLHLDAVDYFEKGIKLAMFFSDVKSVDELKVMKEKVFNEKKK